MPNSSLKTCLWVAFFCLLGSVAVSAAPDGLHPTKTYALLVGVVEWQDASLLRFPRVGRQDRELERALLAWGVPRSQLHFLEDKEATRERIITELEKAAGAAPPDSTFLFYFTGHGLPEGKKVYLAGYD